MTDIETIRRSLTSNIDIADALAALDRLAANALDLSAIKDIAAERRRQVEVEGWSAAHDDQHKYGELAQAAAAYACHTEHREQVDVWAEKVGGGASRVGWFNPYALLWPWDRALWKPKDRRRDLVKAGALIVAEIERLDRAALAAAIERAKEADRG